MSKKNNKSYSHNQITKLKKEGWDIKVHHGRLWGEELAIAKYIYDSGVRDWKRIRQILDKFQIMFLKALRGEPVSVSPRGGYTRVTLRKGNYEFVGKSVCSIADNFQKTKGIDIALGRAVSVKEKARIIETERY